MERRLCRFLLGGFLALLIVQFQGCAYLNSNVNINGALPIVPSFDSTARVDLVVALTGADLTSTEPPSRLGTATFAHLKKVCTQYGRNNDSGDQGTPENQADRRCLAAAYLGFYEINAPTKDLPGTLTARRNAVQEQLLGAAALACTQFKEHLNSLQAHGNFAFGSLATMLAGAGAIATQATSAQFFAGSSAVANGVRAEFNTDYFYKSTVSLIAKSIDMQQAAFLDDLRRKSQIKGYDAYSIEAAVNDAFQYNGLCSLVKGLEGANTALTLLDDPGLSYLNKALTNKASGLSTNGLTIGVLPAVPPTGAPQPPTDVTAQAGKVAGQASVMFKAPLGTGVGPVIAYRVVSNPSDGVDLNDFKGDTTHVISGLRANVSYTFMVTALNRAGSSEAATSAPLLMPPPPAQ